MPPRLLRARTTEAHTAMVRTVAVGPRSGRVFASGGDDGMLFLWAIIQEKPLLQFGPFKSPITTCQFDKTEDFLAFGTEAGLLSVLDLDDGRTHSSWQLPEGSAVTCLCIHPQSVEFVACGTSDGWLLVHSSEQLSPIQRHEAHAGAVLSVAICPGGNLLATTGEDHVIRIYDLTQGALHGTIKPKCDCRFMSVDFHPVEEILAACAEDRSVKIFDIHRIREMKGGFVIGTGSPARICFSQDGEVVAACSDRAVSMFKTTSADHMDHMRLRLGENAVKDLKVFDKGIAIGTAVEKEAGLLVCGTEGFVLLKKKKKRKVSIKKRVPSPEPVAEPAPVPEPAPVRRVLYQAPPANEAIYREFRQDRAEYLALMAQKLGKLGRIKELLASKGLREAAIAVATARDAAGELVSILLTCPDVVTMDNASAVVEVIYTALTIDEEAALSLLSRILRNLGPIIRMNMDNPHGVFYAQSGEIVNGLRGFHDAFDTIRKNSSPGVLVIRRIVNEWHEFFT